MYRENAIDREERPPARLVVALKGQDRRSSAVILFQLFTLPVLAAVLLSVLVTPVVGLAGLVAAAVFLVWRWQRRGDAGTIVMIIESGELIVHAGRRPLARARLRDIEDVALDTKSIRPVQEGERDPSGALHRLQGGTGDSRRADCPRRRRPQREAPRGPRRAHDGDRVGRQDPGLPPQERLGPPRRGGRL